MFEIKYNRKLTVLSMYVPRHRLCINDVFECVFCALVSRCNFSTYAYFCYLTALCSGKVNPKTKCVIMESGVDALLVWSGADPEGVARGGGEWRRLGPRHRRRRGRESNAVGARIETPTGVRCGEGVSLSTVEGLYAPSPVFSSIFELKRRVLVPSGTDKSYF